jgi:hypothetical protein
MRRVFVIVVLYTSSGTLEVWHAHTITKKNPFFFSRIPPMPCAKSALMMSRRR